MCILKRKKPETEKGLVYSTSWILGCSLKKQQTHTEMNRRGRQKTKQAPPLEMASTDETETSGSIFYRTDHGSTGYKNNFTIKKIDVQCPEFYNSCMS